MRAVWYGLRADLSPCPGVRAGLGIGGLFLDLIRATAGFLSSMISSFSLPQR